MATILANKLTNSKLLIKNSLWTLLGNFIPLLSALFSIPFLIKGLGNEKFGILTLIWAIIGYSTLFDFGLSRALTHIIAKKIGENQIHEIKSICQTAIIAVIVLGIIASFLLFGFTDIFISNVIKPSENLISEAKTTFILLIFSIPIMLLTVSFRGILEAYQEFAVINKIKIPMGVYTFLAPLGVLFFTNNLIFVVLALILGRIINFLVFVFAIRKNLAGFFKNIVFDKNKIKPLISFGGWMTVSNIISPLFLTMDRFFIASFISIANVVYYSTPFDVITKLLIIPTGLMSVMFSAFSTEIVHNKTRAKKMYKNIQKYILCLFLPIMISVFLFSKWGLSIWIDSEFASKSFKIAQILAIATFFAGLATPCYSFIQSCGRSDITAKLHILELIIYLPILYFSVKNFGIIGVASAWLFRAMIDFILLKIISGVLLKN
ncbi:MAG: flippase [Candidatus Gastranaerophilales bacterium]|nr:flippase [Candidatus Gastranaerophilales bacterium]